MLNVGVIGLGNTGNQIASLAYEQLKIPVMAVNSSGKDLETISNNIPKKLISDASGESKGAGKNRQLAKKYLKDSIMTFLSSEDVQDFIGDLDVLFVVSSTGGGTGSGTSLIMSSIIASMFVDVHVITIGVLPVMNEALSAHVNTLEYLNELYSTLDGQTYMLYDNDKYSGMPSYKMMNLVNEEVVKDIDVLRCTYNYTTKYDSIDEEDMRRLISFPGRILVARLEDIKERDLDKDSIEDLLIKKINIEKVRDFIGDPDHDFNHLYVNEERKMPNNVFLIIGGLSVVNDRITKISDRIEEIEQKQKTREEENSLNDLGVSELSQKVSSKDKSKKPTASNVDIAGIFSKFGI